MSKVKLFTYILNPKSSYYYNNSESTKTALLEAPRKIVAHIKLDLLQRQPEGLCASDMKALLLKTIEVYTSDWLWETTPAEDAFYEKMLTEGWD